MWYILSLGVWALKNKFIDQPLVSEAVRRNNWHSDMSDQLKQQLPKLKAEKGFKSAWIESPKRIINKILCFRGGDLWFNCSWSQTLFSSIEKFHFTTQNYWVGIGGDRIENVLWRINDIVLPEPNRSVVIHCGTNKIDTSSSDETSLGIVTIARSISHGYLNIEVVFSGLFPRDIHWSTRRVKINKTNAYLRGYCEKSNKICQTTL